MEITSNKLKKAFITELKELIGVLEKTKSSAGNLSEKEIINILLELGIIENGSEFKALLAFVEDNLNVSSDVFVSLISKINHSKDQPCLVHKYCVHCRLNLMQKEEIANKPTLVDLFCGAGGMSLGFKQLGFKIAFANDIEPACIETYSFNHPEIPNEFIYEDDINNIIDEIQSKLRFKDIDVVIGGPPCQGFSTANRQRIIDDPRNKLYKSFVKVVGNVQPKFFVMENVTGMLSVAAQVVEDFASIGYDVHYEILNSADFGVPQNRKRLIFIGNRIGINNASIFDEINLENNFSSKRFVLEDAIRDLPKLEALRIKNATDLDTEESGMKVAVHPNYQKNEYLSLINDEDSNIIFNHKARYNNDRDIEIFGRMHQGDKSDDPKIADIMPYKNRNHIFKDKYFKLVYKELCKTITAHMKFDCNMYVHPTQARGLTPREAARIQSFPDDYFLKGSFTKTYMQIGNSVPPLMSRGIANALLKYIHEN
ncbi:DNA cytosine methyltransferase [Bacillus cytotoxicus]|uniref:DNA cytosine methyltransferase n=1 Tax=Bacillus cytotoxicus TaxID=580165 RepID=A0ACC6A9L0_9BACI|nr:DNA cytosine methyltransferase [Bacillus cytotoxicus]